MGHGMQSFAFQKPLMAKMTPITVAERRSFWASQAQDPRMFPDRIYSSSKCEHTFMKNVKVGRIANARNVEYIDGKVVMTVSRFKPLKSDVIKAIEMARKPSRRGKKVVHIDAHSSDKFVSSMPKRWTKLPAGTVIDVPGIGKVTVR